MSTGIELPGERRAAAREGRVATAILIGSTAAVPLFPAGFTPLGERAELVCSVMSVLLLTVAGLRLVSALPGGERGISYWRASHWFLLWGSVAYGLASLTWLGVQVGSATRIELSSVIDALHLFCLGLLAWIAGYVLGVPRWIQQCARNGLDLLLHGTGPVLRGGSMPWVMYGIGTAARLTSVLLTGRFGYLGDPGVMTSNPPVYSQFLSMSSNLAVFGIALAAFRALSAATRGSKLTLWILVGIEAVVGALGGGKESFIVSVLAVLIPYGAVRRRLSLPILLTGVTLLLLIVVPFNATYRHAVRSDKNMLSPSSAVATAPDILSGTVHAGSPGETIIDSGTALLYRIREVDSLAIITQMTPSTIPYLSPGEFAAAPLIGVVPRAVWPGKPVLDNGYLFSQRYYGLSSSVHTSTGITPVGDLYRHGGWLVMICGMVLLAGAVRLFDALFRPETDPRAICFVLVFLPMLVKSELDVYSMIASVPSGIATATVGAHLMCRRRTTTGMVAS